MNDHARKKLRLAKIPKGRKVMTVGRIEKFLNGDDEPFYVPDVSLAYAADDNGDGTFDVLVDDPDAKPK